VTSTGFVPPVKLSDALQKTIKFEFLDEQRDGVVFYSE